MKENTCNITNVAAVLSDYSSAVKVSSLEDYLEVINRIVEAGIVQSYTATSRIKDTIKSGRTAWVIVAK